MIGVNDKIILFNLDTSEEEKYKIVQFTQVYEPSAMVGAYASDAPYRRVVTSGGGTLDEDGFLLVSTASKLGRAVVGKELGDEIFYELDGGVKARFRVVAIGDKRYKSKNVESLLLYSFDVSAGEDGIGLYKRLIKQAKLPVVARPYWSKHFCFVIEDVVFGRHGEKFFVGTTFNNGVIYQRNKEYAANQSFSEYTGEYRFKIEGQYKFITKVVLKSDMEPIFDVEENVPNPPNVLFITSSGEAVAYTDEMKNQLRIKLKQFRSEKANELNFPAYCIFKNVTLEKIVEKLPTDEYLFELLCDKCIVTSEKYGKQITEIVKEFLNKNGIVEVHYR